MTSASKTTFSRNNINILRLKVTKILQICLKKFCQSRPSFLYSFCNYVSEWLSLAQGNFRRKVCGHQGLISPTFSRAAFMPADPKSAKRQSSHQCLFALLGSMRAKAACKMLVKLTQESARNTKLPISSNQ